MTEYTKIDLDTIRKGGWLSMFPDGRVNANALRRFQDWLYEIGLIGVRNPVTQVLDTSFLDHASAVVTGR